MKYFVVLVGIVTTLLAFQNCTRSGFSEPGTEGSSANEAGTNDASTNIGLFRNDVPLVIDPNAQFGQTQRFSYAPSVIKNPGSEVLHIYSCHNPSNGSFDDEIFYTQVTPKLNGNYQVSASFSFYAGNRPTDWNACDPTVVQGEYQFNGKSYDFAVFYTAMPFERFRAITSSPAPMNSSEYNEVRLVLHSSARREVVHYGSFFTFPRMSEDTFSYGFGQPSAINLNKKGKILLFYSHGRTNSSGSDWHTKFRIVDLSNLSAPVIGAEKSLSSSGITPITNGDFSLAANGKLYAITEDPSVWIPGLKVASGLRLLSMPVDINNLETSLQTGPWLKEKSISKNLSGQTLNHNAGFIRNGFGFLDDLTNVGVIFTGGDSDAKAIEWTYRLYASYFALDTTPGGGGGGQPPQPPPPQPPPSLALTAPQNPSATPSSSPIFSWGASQGHEYYILDLSLSSTFPAGEFANCRVSSQLTFYSWESCFKSPLYVPTTIGAALLAGATYYWRIVAFKGPEVKSSVVKSFTVPNSTGSTPVTISWPTFAGAQNYWVDISTFSDFRWFWNCDSSLLSVTWSQCQAKKYPGVSNPPEMPLVPTSGVKYYYRVVPFINGASQGVSHAGSFQN